MAMENRPQKIPVPRRYFLWSINESSGEVHTHVGPTEFTPSANDRIVRTNERGVLEPAPQLEARPFVVVRDGEYVVLANPIRGDSSDDSPNGSFSPGANKEKELLLGATKIIPGPCGFPLWPGQSAEVRQAHKLGGNHYLLAEAIGALDERSRYARLVIESAGLSGAVIDAGEEPTSGAPTMATGAAAQAGVGGPVSGASVSRQLVLGQRIVIQGRHTPLFIPPTGVEVVPPLEEMDAGSGDREGAGFAALPASVQQECTRLVAQVQAGMSAKQFSTLKNELRHRPDLSSGEKAIMLTALDGSFDERAAGGPKGRGRNERVDSRTRSPIDPYARRAVVLGPKEFCVLFDADGNARIVRGPARVFPGPYDAFLQRGSRRRIYDAYELAEHQALWLRLISPIKREQLAQHLPHDFPLDQESYSPGHEFIVRGRPSVFFPFNEAEVVSPVTGEPHVGNDHDNVVLEAIGIDQKSGIYVRDLRSGIVKTIRGETSYLVDPRSEEHVHRRVPRDQWNLMIAHAEPHKAAGTDAFVTTPWALSILVPNNEAALVTSPHRRRVEVGPKVVLLDYDEQLAPLRMSRGPSKDGSNTLATAFLRYQGSRTSDTFDVESADLVRFRVRVGFKGHFEGDPLAWFQAEDPVKLMADTARARVREAARAETANRLLKDFPQVVRGALLPNGGGLKFAENGMVIDAVDVLAVQVLDSELAQLFSSAQQDVVKLQISEEMAVRRLTAKRQLEDISAQESALEAEKTKRRTQTGLLEADSSHTVELRVAQLTSEREHASLEREHTQRKRALDFELAARRAALEVEFLHTVQRAEAGAKASELGHQVEEKHRGQLARIEAELARAVAEADAVKLQAIQRELVGALHAAADSEVMKAAATNMNLVSLLGGKSPAELFSQLLRGTPLARTVRGMDERDGHNGRDDHGDPGKPSAE